MMTNIQGVAEIEVPYTFELDAQVRQQVLQTAKEADEAEGSISKKNYVVMLTSGNEDGGKRATLAFSAACAAIALELDTHVFLIGDGSHWAYDGACEPVLEPGFPALTDLIDSFIELGGRIFICAACDQVCTVPGEDGQIRRRRAEIQPQGLTTILSHMIGGTTVTF
jgi:predicted peroxiredoxin